MFPIYVKFVLKHNEYGFWISNKSAKYFLEIFDQNLCELIWNQRFQTSMKNSFIGFTYGLGTLSGKDVFVFCCCFFTVYSNTVRGADVLILIPDPMKGPSKQNYYIFFSIKCKWFIQFTREGGRGKLSRAPPP